MYEEYNMLSYKNNQTIPPLYDYYVETDLDSLDDQPVDYSKKYSDQESYEDCRRRKPNVNNQFPANEVSQSMKPSCRSSSDEVKVYCIEGTPVTISSASSFSDLRDIGINNSQQKSDVKCTFPPVNDDEISQDTLRVEKISESYNNKKEETLLIKGKDEMSREVKSVSFRSGDISKASSPLMFSRSSSVGSLNSFEQQSIADDRSSVSAFSALTSGLISPSDLPDSPGEVMSPVLTDKDNSPKIKSSKANSDNESENIELCQKPKLISEHVMENKSASSPVQIPNSKDYIESYKSIRNSDEDENEILVEQLEFSHDSSAEIDEVFSNSGYERDAFVLKSERDSSEQLSVKSDDESDADDILLQQCIQLGMPNKPPENKCDINVSKKVEYPTHPRNIPDSQDLSDQLSVKSDGESDADDILLQQCIQLGMPNKPPDNNCDMNLSKKVEYPTHPRNISDSQIFLKNEKPNLCEESISGRKEVIQPSVKLTMQEESFVEREINASVLHQSHPLENNQLTTDPVKSDDDSDGDDDMMLQRCIELGMPKGSPDNIGVNGDRFLKTCYPSHSVNHNARKVVRNSTIKPQRNPYINEGSNSLSHCASNRMPKESQDKKRLHSRVFNKPDFPPYSVNCDSPRVIKKMYPMKSEGDSDGDEDDIILRHCVQNERPKESWEKKKIKSRRFNKSGYPSHSVSHFSPTALRDNCPDGISDGDEDDDMLAKCISAGMPSPKAVDVQNRLHNSQTGNVFMKLPSCNRSYVPKPSSESSKNSSGSHFRLPPHQPYAPVHSSATWISRTSFIDVDSMRIYRTEDTPILSPSASISDLSSLSFNESFLNNSRNSDCSSESDDDELLLQCIRSGMPNAKRAVA